MMKQGSMDLSILQRHTVNDHKSNSKSDDININKAQVLPAKRIHLHRNI